MYNLVTAHCLSRNIGSQWREVDISGSLVSTIFNIYRKVYLVVYDSFIDKDVFVDMDEFKVAYSGRNITVQEMLTAHEGFPLVTVDTLPSVNLKYARYSIGNKVGYKFDLVKAGYNYDHDAMSETLTDLRLSRPGYETEMDLLHTHCLITVNGYVHMTDTDGEYAYALDGAKTMRISNDNRFGILSFLDIGKLDKIKIERNNILPSREDGTLAEKIVFKVGKDIVDDCFFLVLGGYIIFPENEIFWRTGDDSYTLDLNRIPYKARLMESREFIDISSLGIDVATVSDDAFSNEAPFHDEVIRNYMTMSQSFFVHVNTENLTFSKYGLRRYNTPGSFYFQTALDMPMYVAHGRMVEYWTEKQGTRYHVSVPDSYYRNYALDHRQAVETQNIDSRLMVGRPVSYDGAMALEISSYVG